VSVRVPVEREPPYTRFVRALVVSLLVLGCGAPPTLTAAEPPATRAQPRTHVEADTRNVYERALDGEVLRADEDDDYDEYPFGVPLSESEAVPLTSVWERFRQALADHDADAAARELAPDSISFWDDVRTSALAPDRAPRMQPSVRLLAGVALRAVGRRELDAMDGRSVFARAVRGGWAVPEEASSALGGRIVGARLASETASLAYGTRLPDIIDLDLFDGEWRVRFSSLFTELDSEAVNWATAAGRTEDELLALLVERIAARLGLEGPP